MCVCVSNEKCVFVSVEMWRCTGGVFVCVSKHMYLFLCVSRGHTPL